MLYIVSYDLIKPQKDYASLHDELKNFASWWHYLDSTWLIVSQLSTGDVSKKIRLRMDKDDNLLIFNVTGMSSQGWLPTKAWKWIEGHRAG